MASALSEREISEISVARFSPWELADINYLSVACAAANAVFWGLGDNVLVYRADPGKDVATLVQTITSLGSTPFTEANVDAYVKATYDLKSSLLKPFTPGIEKQIYSTTVNGAVQSVSIVSSVTAAMRGS